MFTTLKSIIRKLPLSDVPICYYDYREGNQYPINFRCIAKECQSKYDLLSDKEKQDYVSESARIYVPKLPIHEFSMVYKDGDRLTWEYTIDKIRKLGFEITSGKDAEDMFSLYTILHEVGHWNHFCSVGKKIWIYTQDSNLAEEVFNLQNRLQEKIRRQGYKVFPSDKLEQKRLLKKYNSVPSEKIANDFADANFCEMWKLIQDL